jgi:hypothetical protein
VNYNCTLPIFQHFYDVPRHKFKSYYEYSTTAIDAPPDRAVTGDQVFGNHVTYMLLLDFNSIVDEAQVRTDQIWKHVAGWGYDNREGISD